MTSSGVGFLLLYLRYVSNGSKLPSCITCSSNVHCLRQCQQGSRQQRISSFSSVAELLMQQSSCRAVDAACWKGHHDT